MNNGGIGTALTDSAAAGGAAAVDTWPWRNLFRASDPIGGPIFTDCPASEDLYQAEAVDAMAKGGPAGGDNNDVDRQFLDPVFGRASGNMAYPATLRHSGYFEDPYFQACVSKVIELARQRAAAKVLPAPPDAPPDEVIDTGERPEAAPDEPVPL